MKYYDKITGGIRLSILPALLITGILFMACTDSSMPLSSNDNVVEEDGLRAKKTPPNLVFNEFNGNYYEAVEAVGITWDVASAATEGLKFNKCVGHLATITSQNENDWIVSTFPQAAEFGYWLGGKQALDATDPAEGWSWITGENWIYTNWTNDEPNDFNGDVEESLHFSPTFFGAGGGTWNDQRADNIGFIDENGRLVSFVDGYVVEYDCGQKVTGHGNRDGDLPQVSMVANKGTDTSVKGQAEVKYPKDRGSFHVEISCLSVWGNEAWVGGTVTRSSFDPFPEGQEIVWTVADNGEGGGNNDGTGFYFYNPNGEPLADQCDTQTIGTPFFVSTKGNIQIH